MVSLTRKRIWGSLFIAAGLLVAPAAALVWYLAPVQYEAFALLRVKDRPPVVLEDRAPEREEFAVFKRTQAQLLLSNIVLNAALRDPKINSLGIVEAHRDDPVAWLKGQLTIEYPDDAEIMRVALRGTHPEELTVIVDKIVEVYLREIVQHERALQMDNEAQLQRAYEQRSADYQKQLDNLRQLEQLYQTSGSEEARLKKELALKDLDRLLDQRAAIAEDIRQTELEIALAKAGDEIAKEVRTSTVGNTQLIAMDNPRALELLTRKLELLNEQLKQADARIESTATSLARLDLFNSQIASKQEEIESARTIRNQLKTKLDSATIERHARDRVTMVDSATLVSNAGDVARRNLACGALAALGLGLIVMGLAIWRPRH